MIDIITRARAIHIEDELGRRNVRLSGKTNERSGPCPICGGEDRFSVNLGKQVFNCRGCGAKGHGAIDLVMFLDGCAFPAAVETLAGERPGPAAKQTFDYPDETGRLLYQVERIDLDDFRDGKRNKKFIQRRPNGNGGWINGHGCLDGVRRVPYRLPELIEAVGSGNRIVIVEGERKVDLLRSWNVPATCNSGGYGSSKIWTEHAAYFRDANVIVLPDNDETGRKFAGAGISCRVRACGGRRWGRRRGWGRWVWPRQLARRGSELGGR